MSWNLFLKEMKRNALALILWMVVISILVSFAMSLYPSVIENQSKVFEMMKLVPEEALKFIGIQDFRDKLKPLEFYAVNNVIYMMVLGSIYAIVTSSNIFLGEEYNKTAEYLLSRPLTRNDIFISKMLVLILFVFILNMTVAFSGLTTMKLVHDEPVNIRAFLILSVYTLLLNTLFTAIGLMMSILVKRPKPITTFCVGLVLVLYFIHTISKITEGVAKIGYLSPFSYVDLDTNDTAYRLEFWHLLYFLGITLLLTSISFKLYQRKDIYT